VFLNFLERAGVREEVVPNGRGDVVFYNLGKFSQLISDFEAIHFHSKPVEKYASFADFLEHRAEDAYPEGWQVDKTGALLIADDVGNSVWRVTAAGQ
jgi:DNA helicase-2/ATP-dependent DNA helicase PcrA